VRRFGVVREDLARFTARVEPGEEWRERARDAGMRVRGVRGATTVAQDAKDEILSATAELLQEMISRNDLAREDLVSIVFTATPDLQAVFPAEAARGIGISDVPLLCARELDVEGAMPLCIRVLMHAYTERDLQSVRHVYLGDAKKLRSDLAD
jgi:chorismate mutase